MRLEFNSKNLRKKQVFLMKKLALLLVSKTLAAESRKISSGVRNCRISRHYTDVIL